MKAQIKQWRRGLPERARKAKPLNITDGLLALFLLALVLFGAPLIDLMDEGRIERSIEAQKERQYMQPRDSHPPNVWQRVCIDGENWINGRCQ
jgi:hypothetical protein